MRVYFSPPIFIIRHVHGRIAFGHFGDELDHAGIGVWIIECNVVHIVGRRKVYGE